MVEPSIGVAIPAHPARVYNGMLQRAVESVWRQELLPNQLVVEVDWERLGAPATRQRALDAIRTEWVAFLDSDDQFLPDHLAKLSDHARQTGADYVYSWFETDPPGLDPFGPKYSQQQIDPADPQQTTITVMVRTELARKVGFWDPVEGVTIHGQRAGEDYAFTKGCLAAGARFSRITDKTWLWSHHGANAMGMTDRGDALAVVPRRPV